MTVSDATEWLASYYMHTIGMAAERLSHGQGQLTLFTDPKRERQLKLDAVADQINRKFGKRAIRRHG